MLMTTYIPGRSLCSFSRKVASNRYSLLRFKSLHPSLVQLIGISCERSYFHLPACNFSLGSKISVTSSFEYKIVIHNERPLPICKPQNPEELNMSFSLDTTQTAEPVPKCQNHAQVRKLSGPVSPPIHKGMLSLKKEAFDKDIKLPTVYVYEDKINPQTLQKFKKFILKVQGLKPIISVVMNKGTETESSVSGGPDEDPSSGRKIKKIFINPELVKGGDLTQFVQHEIQPEPAIVSSVGYETVKFTYENWTLNQIMDSILPDDNDKISGFSQIGHIVHVNLRDHLLPFKNVIGQVFLEKISNAKTVVNKINIIDSKYRNFQMEVLAGDNDTVVTVKENRCEFEFDFANVYWNPRLSSEHDRLVKSLGIGPHETLYDVFAGVGPFAIPAAKRKIRVLANDLNPNSYKWLEHNVKKNKVADSVKCFNLDGKAFIQQVASSDLQHQIFCSSEETKNRDDRRCFHFVMNLPAMAVEFLESFWGIIPTDKILPKNTKIIVHVYCFIKDIEGFSEKAVALVNDQLGYDLPKENIENVVFVRNVAPNKEMMRVSFVLPMGILNNNYKRRLEKRKFCEIDEDV